MSPRAPRGRPPVSRKLGSRARDTGSRDTDTRERGRATGGTGGDDEADAGSPAGRPLARDLDAQREILQAIVENLSDGVVVADEAGRFVLFNPAAESILGIGLTDSEPQRWSEVYGVYRADRATPFPWDEMPLIRALGGTATENVEMFIRHPLRPEGLFIEVSGTPLVIGGRLRGAVAVFRDITHRKHADEAKRLLELAQQQTAHRRVVEAELERVRDTLVRETRFSAIGELAASVAHDLRNPLGAVRNSLFFLSRRVPAGEADWHRHLSIIERETMAANGIIDNLLEMSRGREPRRELVDLGRAIRDVFDPDHPDTGVELQVRLAVDPFEVFADRGQLARVLRNLLTNAVQAMDGNGRIVVEARREGEHDVVILTDTGPGVPDALQDRIFDPLFTTRAKGTGLGLAICRQICERHGGAIRLLPTSGTGAGFEIRLPRPRGASPSE